MKNLKNNQKGGHDLKSAKVYAKSLKKGSDERSEFWKQVYGIAQGTDAYKQYLSDLDNAIIAVANIMQPSDRNPLQAVANKSTVKTDSDFKSRMQALTDMKAAFPDASLKELKELCGIA